MIAGSSSGAESEPAAEEAVALAGDDVALEAADLPR